MIESAEISDCFGFTEEEVTRLCDRFHMDFDTVKEWYDGYHLISAVGGKRTEYSIYSPNSIVEAMMRSKYKAYWNQTETYEALKAYIQMNLDGLKDAVIRMLSGESIKIDTEVFKNDMGEFTMRDEVLTLLVHLGYLTYNQDSSEVSIPNLEVSTEFVRSIKHSSNYENVATAIETSRSLVEALWNLDARTVAIGVEKAHEHFPAIHYIVHKVSAEISEKSFGMIAVSSWLILKEYIAVIIALAIAIHPHS